MEKKRTKPLTESEREMLLGFSNDIENDDLKEVRRIIARYLFDELGKHVEKIWDEKGYNDKTIEKWLTED